MPSCIDSLREIKLRIGENLNKQITLRWISDLACCESEKTRNTLSNN